MTDLHLGPEPEDFVWASGIEDTFVPQTRAGHRALDEYELMGHYDHWREDLALARDAGVQALRWGVPWYRVQPAPDQWDWRWSDEVIPYLVEELGIVPIIDLMHYGCPFWLRREFDNDDYPRAVAAYAAAFARRYRRWVRWYTPLNEPLVNALLCGKRGVWPPYLRGDAGYIRVMVQLAQGILNTVEAIREVQPEAVMVHVEATGLRRAMQEELATLAVEDEHRGYLSFDLITGRVDRSHPLFAWLLRHGTPLATLRDFARRAIPLDVVGLNFYPQWSTLQIYEDARGRVRYRPTEKEGNGFEGLIEDYARRYGAPILITETSAHGSDAVRAAWLCGSLAAIRRLRERGVPVYGYTWFPLFTMIDWRYRFGTKPVEQYRLELGLYQLNSHNGATPRWQATPLLADWHRLRAHPAESVGTLATPARLAPQPALVLT